MLPRRASTQLILSAELSTTNTSTGYRLPDNKWTAPEALVTVTDAGFTQNPFDLCCRPRKGTPRPSAERLDDASNNLSEMPYG
jgi:hypothetical protein